MKKILIYRFLVTIILSSVFGCTTPYQYQANGFEDAIVVEATITNEFKNQKIKISRTYELEEKVPTIESNATVYITDDIGNKYDFEQIGEVYSSLTQFQASPDRAYQLHIRTQNGRSYISNTEKLPQQTQIDKLESKAITKNGELGVQITVNSSDPTNNSRYYRYEYDETYQVVAPRWSITQAIVRNGQLVFQDRKTEARVCYLNKSSDDLILTNTNQLSEDKVIDFPVRFISSKDPVIRNRYSILVKQYVQSLAAHTFYETLKEISNNGSILSQTQPGFFYGNINPVDNPGEKVIGYFEISSYSEKRLFFSFTDVLKGQPLPNYQYDCPAPIPQVEIGDYYFNYCFGSNNCQGSLVLQLIGSGVRVYYPDESPSLLLYPVECGDCTSFSSNIKPSFWID